MEINTEEILEELKDLEKFFIVSKKIEGIDKENIKKIDTGLKTTEELKKKVESLNESKQNK